MINTIFGIKKGMSARFEASGKRIPVTQIEANPSFVLNKFQNKVQIGFGQKKKAKKTENAFVTSIGFAPKFIKEVKGENTSDLKIGDKITVGVFEKQDLVKITGISKGHGFSGGVKRWGFHGGPKTHGQSDRHRAPGSIGQGTTPGRVLKGKKMAGHFGNVQKTILNLEVIEIDPENNLLLVKGPVPGSKNGLLLIQKTGKAKAYTPPPAEKPDEEEEAQEKGNDKGQKENQSEEKGDENAKA